jgi:septum formation protein
MSAFLQAGRPQLILASASKTRARLLEAAGLAFSIELPGLDEATMRLALRGEQSLAPHDVAEVLARAKAEAVSDLAKDAYVVGADQILAFGDEILSKPENMEAARRQLFDLKGKSHTLHTAVAVATGGETIWAQTESATLAMRELSPVFVGRYLAAVGDEVLRSVGAYQIEGIGIQLFEKIDGDYFSILGLPLLPLLGTLRREGVIDG